MPIHLWTFFPTLLINILKRFVFTRKVNICNWSFSGNITFEKVYCYGTILFCELLFSPMTIVAVNECYTQAVPKLRKKKELKYIYHPQKAFELIKELLNLLCFSSFNQRDSRFSTTSFINNAKILLKEKACKRRSSVNHKRRKTVAFCGFFEIHPPNSAIEDRVTIYLIVFNRFS